MAHQTTANNFNVPMLGQFLSRDIHAETKFNNLYCTAQLANHNSEYYLLFTIFFCSKLYKLRNYGSCMPFCGVSAKLTSKFVMQVLSSRPVKLRIKNKKALNTYPLQVTKWSHMNSDLLRLAQVRSIKAHIAHDFTSTSRVSSL